MMMHYPSNLRDTYLFSDAAGQVIDDHRKSLKHHTAIRLPASLSNLMIRLLPVPGRLNASYRFEFYHDCFFNSNAVRSPKWAVLRDYAFPSFSFPSGFLSQTSSFFRVRFDVSPTTPQEKLSYSCEAEKWPKRALSSTEQHWAYHLWLNNQPLTFTDMINTSLAILAVGLVGDA